MLRLQKPCHKDGQIQHVTIAVKITFRKYQGAIDSVALRRERVVERRMGLKALARLDLDGKDLPIERLLHKIELADFFRRKVAQSESVGFELLGNEALKRRPHVHAKGVFRLPIKNALGDPFGIRRHEHSGVQVKQLEQISLLPQ